MPAIASISYRGGMFTLIKMAYSDADGDYRLWLQTDTFLGDDAINISSIKEELMLLIQTWDRNDIDMDLDEFLYKTLGRSIVYTSVA